MHLCPSNCLSLPKILEDRFRAEVTANNDHSQTQQLLRAISLVSLHLRSLEALAPNMTDVEYPFCSLHCSVSFYFFQTPLSAPHSNNKCRFFKPFFFYRLFWWKLFKTFAQIPPQYKADSRSHSMISCVVTTQPFIHSGVHSALTTICQGWF